MVRTINICFEGDLMSFLKGTTACLALRSLFFRLQTELSDRAQLFFSGRQQRNWQTVFWTTPKRFWTLVSYFQPGNHERRLPAVGATGNGRVSTVLLLSTQRSTQPAACCSTTSHGTSEMLPVGTCPFIWLLLCMSKSSPIPAQKLVTFFSFFFFF